MGSWSASSGRPRPRAGAGDVCLAAIVGAALNTAAAHRYSLTVDGLDLIRPPGLLLGGVLLDTVELTVMGPGGVSGLKFTVDDPQKNVVITDGMVVRMWDHGANWPLFLGQVNAWAPRPMGLGREIDVDCVGVESVLDWMVLPAAITLATGLEARQAIQAVHAQCESAGWILNATVTTGSGSNAAGPISNGGGSSETLGYDLVLAAGTSLREAHGAINAACQAGTAVPNVRAVTVDFYGGLRSWIDDYVYGGAYTFGAWEDSGCLFIEDTTGTHNPPEFVAAGLKMGRTGAKYRRVMVVGANAAGSGIVSDGSGIAGPTAVLRDSTSDSATKKSAIGRAYLAMRGGTSLRGSYSLESVYTPDWVNVWSLSSIAFLHTDITDAQAGDSETLSLPPGFQHHRVPITSIRKRFLGGGLEDWEVDFGAETPAVSGLIRRLTREIKS